MRTTLVQYGDQKALVVDKALIEQLGIGMDTPLDLSADGNVLIIAPVREEVDAEFQAMMEKINSRYSNAFRRLAE